MRRWFLLFVLTACGSASDSSKISVEPTEEGGGGGESGSGGGDSGAAGVPGGSGGTSPQCAPLPCREGESAKCNCLGCEKLGTAFCKDDGTFDDCSCPVGCDTAGATPILCSAAGNGGATSIVCAPGEESSCACPQGGTGVRICNDEGTGYSNCVACSQSGGASGSGGAGGSAGVAGSGGTKAGSGGAIGGSGGGEKPPECGDIFCGQYTTPNGSKTADCGGCAPGFQCIPYSDNVNNYCCKPSTTCQDGFCGKKTGNCGQEVDCSGNCNDGEVCVSSSCCAKPSAQPGACGVWTSNCGASVSFSDCGIKQECVPVSVPGVTGAGVCKNYCKLGEQNSGQCGSVGKKFNYSCSQKNEWMASNGCDFKTCLSNGECYYCCSSDGLLGLAVPRRLHRRPDGVLDQVAVGQGKRELRRER